MAQAKGHDEKRQELIESTFEEVAASARNDLELQVEKYDSEAEAYDALRPSLTLRIREFMKPTYEGIASEVGTGSAARMRNHLDAGVQASAREIGAMVKDVVRENWQGLTGSVEKRVTEFFDELEGQFREQSERLKQIAEHPSMDDEKRVGELQEIEDHVGTWIVEEAS